jgi:hypothetical protein
MCLSCPSGYVFDFLTNRCVTSITNNCPSTSFWNGQQCITCYLPNYWNDTSKTCLSCPAGTNYDTSMKTCLTCPAGYTYNSVSFLCTATSTNPPVGGCPSNAPFWNGQQCVTCYLPQYWNYNTNNC